MVLAQAVAVNQLAEADAAMLAVQHQAAAANRLAEAVAAQLLAAVANQLAVDAMQVLAQSPRCTKLICACWASSSRSVVAVIHWLAIQVVQQHQLAAPAQAVDRLQ